MKRPGRPARRPWRVAPGPASPVLRLAVVFAVVEAVELECGACARGARAAGDVRVGAAVGVPAARAGVLPAAVGATAAAAGLTCGELVRANPTTAPDTASAASVADPASAVEPRTRRGLGRGPRRGMAVRPAARLSSRSASAASIRSSGFLRSSPLITGDSSGPACAAGGGSSATTAVRLASAPAARSNGPWPSTAAYSDAPSPHRSPAGPDGPPMARSGAV